MKKRYLAFILAVAIGAACLPFISGCSASLKYELTENENGEKYYTVSCSGVISALSGELVIASEYGAGEEIFPVKAIADEGFSASGITKVVIPDSVTTIGKMAFYCCSALREVVFGENSELTSISVGAFGYCDSLSKIQLPDSVTALEYGAFLNCTSLESFNFNNVSKIGPECFYWSGLKSLNVPDKVTEIGYGAFYSCFNLENAVIGNGVTELKSGVFGYCTALKSITFTDSVKKIEGFTSLANGKQYRCAFYAATALEKVYFKGTEEQWQKIEIGENANSGQDNNNAVKNAEKVFNFES